VARHRFGSLFRLAGEAIHVEFEFGTQTLQTLARIAQAVEESVYVKGSLVRTPTGLGFRLANPPLRIGAFSQIRVFLNGTPIAGPQTHLRVGPDGPWRSADTVSATAPLELQAGTSMDIALDGPVPDGPLTLRLELQNVAIRPLVWCELRESAREMESG
jgi:hypothetical protein